MICRFAVSVGAFTLLSTWSEALRWKPLRHETQSLLDSQQRCSVLKKTIVEDNVASKGQPRLACACHDNNSGNGTTLTCNDACQYCNHDLSRCGHEQFSESYGPAGDIVLQTEVFRYDHGVENLIEFNFLDCKDDATGQVSCSTCEVAVDGTQCTSCQMSECSDGQRRPSFDCSNVESGAVYSLCDSTILPPSDSVFEYLTSDPNEYQMCNLLESSQVERRELQGFGNTGTAAGGFGGGFGFGNSNNASTSNAFASSSTAAANKVCALQRNVENCPSLLANLTAIDGCECYNFCGSEFAKCCNYGSCNVTCTNGGVITAGCQVVCKKYAESCSTNSDCCSNRCVGGECRKSAFSASTTKDNTKLSVSAGLGGAAGAAGVRRNLKVGAKLRGI